MEMDLYKPYDFKQINVYKIILYLRKSRAEGKESVEEVLARHEKILQDWAIQNFGEKVPEENIYREVVSGETLDEREEIKKIFNRLEKEDIRGLLVVEPQRISRGDMLDAGRVVQMLKYSNTLCMTITKIYDLNNKLDRQLFENQLIQGNQYLEYHKEIMDRGKALSIREGKYIGSTPPFGYGRKALEKGYMLVINKEEAPTVKLIFDLFVDDGLSTQEIADYLNKHQFKSRSGSLWDYGMVRHVLKHEVYYGSVAWGKRPVIKKLVNGQLTKFRETSDEYMLFQGLHEAIVTKEKWDKAQDKIKGHPSSRNGTSRELKNPLAGLVVCKKCGYAMVRVKNTKRNKKRRKVRKYELDKIGINKLIREARENKGLAYKEIAEFLDVTETVIASWFGPKIKYVYYSDTFSEKWHELKFLLEINETKYDEQITTYIDPEPLKDTLMCNNNNCDMVSSCLESIEEAVLNELKVKLKEFNFYVDNYEEEIIKERASQLKTIEKIKRQFESLKKELKNLNRARNREEFTYQEYIEMKRDIEEEIEVLEGNLREFEDEEEMDTLYKYKKAIPKLQDCLEKYHTLSIAEKNIVLKSLIEKIVYSKSVRMNWRKDIEDDTELEITMSL